MPKEKRPLRQTTADLGMQEVARHAWGNQGLNGKGVLLPDEQ